MQLPRFALRVVDGVIHSRRHRGGTACHRTVPGGRDVEWTPIELRHALAGDDHRACPREACRSTLHDRVGLPEDVEGPEPGGNPLDAEEVLASSSTEIGLTGEEGRPWPEGEA